MAFLTFNWKRWFAQSNLYIIKQCSTFLVLFNQLRNSTMHACTTWIGILCIKVVDIKDLQYVGIRSYLYQQIKNPRLKIQGWDQRYSMFAIVFPRCFYRTTQCYSLSHGTLFVCWISADPDPRYNTLSTCLQITSMPDTHSRPSNLVRQMGAIKLVKQMGHPAKGRVGNGCGSTCHAHDH